MKEDKVREAVVRGATLLDAEVPDWPLKIDERKLRLENTSYCVLGQVYGHYNDGMHALKLNYGARREEGSKAYGFDIPTFDYHDEDANEFAYNQLRDAWLYEIAARLKVPPLISVPDEVLVPA